MSPRSYSVDFGSPVYHIGLSMWIAVLTNVLNFYMDASLRSITGGKYYPEGWS